MKFMTVIKLQPWHPYNVATQTPKQSCKPKKLGERYDVSAQCIALAWAKFYQEITAPNALKDTCDEFKLNLGRHESL